jgi:hypothetical protein
MLQVRKTEGCCEFERLQDAVNLKTEGCDLEQLKDVVNLENERM